MSPSLWLRRSFLQAEHGPQPGFLWALLGLSFFLPNKGGVGSARFLPGANEADLEGLGPESGLEKGVVHVGREEEARGKVLQCLFLA